MIFKHEEKGLKIEFSWKEIFNIVLHKSIKFEAESTYKFYSHFMKLISEAMAKYGDAKKYGQVKDNEVKTK